MEIKQENTSVTGNSGESTRPITSKRTINTQVVVKSGDTIALGGLINDEKIENIDKVPCLGDIPFLGYLFKVSRTNYKKTNLFVFITPTIVRTPEDQRKVNQRVIKQKNKSFEDIRIDIENRFRQNIR